jgi:outer membrane protein
MKKLILIATVILFSATTVLGQRFAYVDTEYILNKMPEYLEAQKRLDGFADEWRQEVDRRVQEIEQMYKKYQAEQYLMDENTKRRREDEIVKKENDLKTFQQAKFGYEGDLFKKRQELVKPIQDKVYNAIKDLAESKRLDFILDKSSSGAMMLYSNPQFDRSDEILKALGY